jgi:2-hydroxychromene-2-carboxylate isomerase
VKRVDFYFDFISPYSYLASAQIEDFSKANGVQFEWIPVNLPKLIKYSGNTPPATIKNKALYSLRDLKRWAAYLHLPFKMIMPGSFDSRPAMRICAALEGEERARFCLDLFDALWSGAVDPTEEGWLDQVFKLKSFPEVWMGQSRDILDENTAMALKAGAFGVPTFILHDRGRPEIFFGVDHMEFLARACRQD